MVAQPQVKAKINLPGPTPFPLTGGIPNVWQFAQDPIGYSNKVFRDHGRIASLVKDQKFNLYSSDSNCPGTILAYGPDIIKDVTMKHDIYHKHPMSGKVYGKREESQRTKPLKTFGVGLFGVNGQVHIDQRKLMMPSFHRRKILSYQDDMTSLTQLRLDSLVIDEPVAFDRLIEGLTMSIATQTMFGEDIEQKDKTVGEIFQEIIDYQASQMSNLIPYDLPGFPFHGYLNVLQRYEEKMTSIIADKRKTLEEANDVLSMLIEARDEESGLELTEEELIGHISTLFLVGHETTSSSLTWIMLILSQHPQIMSDLVDELDGVLQGDAPTLEQLDKLPLLERVIKESLRVLTAIPWNGRITSEDTTLGGYDIPAGTEVLASIYHTHHMPELYPDPEAFKPERWETINPSIYEYNPFSAGPRLCIGAGFAMMQMKIILAMLLQHCRWEYAPGQTIDRSGIISIKPKTGLTLIPRSRDGNYTPGVGKVTGNVREMVNLP